MSQSQCTVQCFPNKGNKLLISIQVLSLLAFVVTATTFHPLGTWWITVPFYLSLILTLWHQAQWCFTVPRAAHGFFAVISLFTAGVKLTLGIDRLLWFLVRASDDFIIGGFLLRLILCDCISGILWLIVGILEIIVLCKKRDESRMQNGDHTAEDHQQYDSDGEAVAVHVKGTKITLPIIKKKSIPSETPKVRVNVAQSWV